METAIPSSFWTPQEFSQRLSGSARSSGAGVSLGNGVIVERRQEQPQEIEAAPLTHHFLILTLERPLRFWRCKHGLVKDEIHVPGSVSLVPSGLAHQSGWETPAEFLYLFLDPRFVERIARTYLGWEGDFSLACPFAVHDPQIEYIGRALAFEAESGMPNGAVFAESLSIALVVRLVRNYVCQPVEESNEEHLWHARPLPYQEMRQVLEFIDANLERRLSLREIAATIGVSTNYFASLFTKAMGESPHQYLIRQRVELAMTLLRRGDLTVAEISTQVGFYDQAHLSRHFKRLTGSTPGRVSPKS